MSNKKQIAVIGIGQFGESLAINLEKLGHEVMIIDTDEEKIERLSDRVSHAVVADVMIDGTLNDLGISNFDVVIIGMSSNHQASVIATLTAKDLGVPVVMAKAKDDVHARILKKIGADKVIIPERDMGLRLAHSITSRNAIDILALSKDHSIVELSVPSKWVGMSILDLRIRENFGVSIVAIKRDDKIKINPTPTQVINEGDMIVVVGKDEEISKVEAL